MAPLFYRGVSIYLYHKAIICQTRCMYCGFRSWYSIVPQGDAHTASFLVFGHVSSHVLIYRLVSSLPELYLATKEATAGDVTKVVRNLSTQHPILQMVTAGRRYLGILSLHSCSEQP